MSKNDSITRDALVKLEVIESQGRKDPLDIMWADKWRLSDLINKLGLYVRQNTEVAQMAHTKENVDLAIRALFELSNGIRAMACQSFYYDDESPRQLVFVYEKTAYGITIIEEESK